MSKRGAGDNWASGEDRYGGPAPGMENADKPVQATAAQMARRKIAAAKKPGANRARSGSPAVFEQQNAFGGGGMFGGGATQQQPQQQPAANPFVTNSFNFAFGGPQTNGNSAAAPFQFGASTPAPSQPQQNGTPNMFGQSAAPSFGTSFSTNASQPQQNGSTSMFNQPSQQSSNTGFGFGLTPSTQQNGTSTPSTSFGGFGSQPQQNNTNGTSGISFGGGAQEKQEPKPSTPFTGFGQTPAAPAANNEQPANSFGGFGQSTTQNGEKSNNPFGGLSTPSTKQNGDKPSTGFFGQDKPKENGQGSTGLFAGLNQPKTLEAPKPSTMFPALGQKPSESTERATTPFAGFGQKPAESSDKPSFGASQAEQQTPKPATSLFNTETPKPTTNFFGGLSNTQPSKPTNGLFDAPSATGPASTGKGLFGAQVMSSDTSKGKSSGSVFDNLPPRETPVFGSHIPGQAYQGDDDDEEPAESSKVELFPKSKSLEKANADPAPPPSNPFAGFGSTQPTPGSSLFKTSSAQQDTSMTTPNATPQKSLFAPSETPATQPPPRSLFDRINSPEISSTPATQPPRSLFDRAEPKPDDTPKASLFNNRSATPTTTKSLFPQVNSTAAPSSLFQKPAATAETPAPAKNLFSQTAAAPTTPAPAPTAPSATFKAPPATAPVSRTFAAPGRSGLSQVSNATPTISEAQRIAFRGLNDSLVTQLSKQDAEKDWSEILRYALIASAEIAGRQPPSESELNPAPPQPPPVAQPVNGSSNLFSAATAKPVTSSASFSSQGASSTATGIAQSNMFAQTPKADPPSSLFSKPPATAPTKKRVFEEDSDDASQQPATEKRSKPNEPPQYPKLPSSASATAKLFASTLDKPKDGDASKPASTSGFNPSTKPLFSAPTAESKSSKPAGSGFTPSFGAQSATSSAPSSAGFTPAAPSSSGFAPIGGVAGGDFLGSFGAVAKAQEEKDRKRRKAEDYDSDEETEEQWLKRDKEEQEAKRKKIEEAAKGATGFSFTASTPAKQPTAAALEKAQGKGDNTWKPETPIKFKFNSASTTTTPAGAPNFGGSSIFGSTSTDTTGKVGGGNLFGPSSTTSTDTSGKLAPPSTGFNFSSQPSSLGVSRATTPGVTTDGEGSSAAVNGDDDDEEAQKEPQAEDQTGLTAEERDANDVLAELHDVKTSKHELNDAGQKKWVSKGYGVVYLLKDKATGKTRILSRVGTGKLTLNYNPIKGAKYFVHPKKDTMVMASFVDHLHATPAALGQFIITTSSADDAKKLARILTEGMPQ